MKNVNIPDKFLPEDRKVIGYQGLDYEHLVVFCPGGDAMIIQDFRREQIIRDEPLDPGEYCVIPADEDGKLLWDDDRVDELLKGIPGFNPRTE